jgi:hypothetical protein
MGLNQKLSDHFPDSADFELMLATAKRRAKDGREEDFLNGLEDKFKTYGSRMFMSENQSRWLCDIAARS